MAVSQMQKLSLILPKDDLDSLLLALQSEAKIQIYDVLKQVRICRPLSALPLPE